tara:strand:+ start:336 stop:659 length:324 start_codon:yes stop_codon:yes gene_type:complete
MKKRKHLSNFMDIIKLINDMTFEYEKEKKALEAIETIFSLVASRDRRGLRRLARTKLGSAFLDIAEEYGENTRGTMREWHFDKKGERFARRFEMIDINEEIDKSNFL